MHGIGNDYVYFNCMHKSISSPQSLAIRLSDRHFSVGGDGVILIEKSKRAQAKMRIFNADGSEGKTCGNGVRCVGKFLYDFGYVTQTEIDVETLSGITHLSLSIGADGKAQRVTADMGKANFSPTAIPLNAKKAIVAQRVSLLGSSFTATCVSMGNPHLVLFGNMPKNVDEMAQAVVKSGYFPLGVNVEFAEIVSPSEIRARVVERGSGETLSCGSGACAIAVSAVACGYAKTGEDILVRLRGGSLVVHCSKNNVYLTGDVALAYEGLIEL